MTENKSARTSQEDLDVIIEAGELMMESGAEIYRIEETMRHIAASLKMKHFEAYVADHEIIVSGTNSRGMREARVATSPETVIHLGKIESVNALSREIEQMETISPEMIAERLKSIREMPGSPLWEILLAYFVGSGGFSYAIGSTLRDSLASAVIGLIMGLVLQKAGKWIRTTVLLTIIGSAVVTVLSNFLYLNGIVDNQGRIILGTLMLLVPGAVFTNSVREFSQNNHVTGLTLMMASLLTCLSIAVGIVAASDIFLFAEPITQTLSLSSATGSFSIILARTIMAGLGTVAFAYLFHAPKRYFPDLGLLGSLSWMMFLLLNLHSETEIIPIFVPALFVALISRYLSVKRKCPVSIFLSTSIFPLIPGLTFFLSVYFLMIGTPALAWTYMRSCFISAFAIAIAIIIMHEIGGLNVRRKG